MITTRRTLLVQMACISLSACSGALNNAFGSGAALYRYNGMDYFIVEDSDGTGIFSGPPGSERLTESRAVGAPTIVQDGRLIGRVDRNKVSGTRLGRAFPELSRAGAVFVPRSAIIRQGPVFEAGGHH
jgi:hypothetical protein